MSLPSFDHRLQSKQAHTVTPNHGCIILIMGMGILGKIDTQNLMVTIRIFLEYSLCERD